MLTCFLFADHLDDENGLSLCLDEQGAVHAPLLLRSLEECRVLQEHARTVVVLPTRLCSLHEVALPWLSDQKARAAIPYALEDDLAQPVAVLHCAFDKAHYDNHHYLVVVMEQHIMTALMSQLARLDLSFDVITLDWFALRANEACILENQVLVHDQSLKGAVSIELLDRYWPHQSPGSSVFRFLDSVPVTHAEAWTPVDETSFTWIAKRLHHQHPMNLCQGLFQHNIRQHQSTRWYQWAACVCLLWLVSVLVMNGIQWWVIKRHVTELTQQIAVEYRVFFPASHQVINPRFRISQWLKKNERNQNTRLWSLLSQLGSVLFSTDKPLTHPTTLQQWQFQNQTLSVTLACPDFAALEQLEARLQAMHIGVHQRSAATHAHQVIATLDLT